MTRAERDRWPRRERVARERGEGRPQRTADGLLRHGLQYAARAALGLCRLWRGVHPGRGILPPRRGCSVPQGHHAVAASGQRAAPGMGDPVRDAQLDRASKPGRPARGGRDSAGARLRRDPVHRQPLRFHGGRVRGADPYLRRLPHRCDGGEHFLPERGARRRPLRQRFGHVRAGCRSLPNAYSQTPDHQAVSEPDGHCRERPALHRGGQRRARGGQHLHGACRRHRDPQARGSAEIVPGSPARR